MSQSQIEAYTRRAGAAVALAAASALTTGFPALEPRAHVVLALHAILLLGCAAVLLSPAHGDGGPEAARGTTVLGSLRWLGFAGMALSALHVDAEEAPRGTVRDLLLFLVFLAGVWGVYLSMVRGRGEGVPRPRNRGWRWKKMLTARRPTPCP
ncbi:uncharacterized protein LOC100382338 [Zea mays]|jgi:hypothetical protein|uniref:Transmembrane protein n=1 Tax=Zea mays TaxID=4577 RepID=C0P6P6_MAIZE|nr:uncharacterized protein LOC100382338 [Zea mays]ACN28662.1 unknown [Zea mays]ONM13847.1 hypothetical protein ZEAMMB73_Zm00001d002290 [Zea mays]|eukprot:NP_001168557.1 uncharacterized protein LOC100382338 [Zea mays]